MGFFDKFKKEQLTEEEKAQKKADRLEMLQEKLKIAEERHEKALQNIAVRLEFIGGMSGVPKNARLYRGENPGQIKIEKKNMDLLEYQWGEQGARSVGKAATGAIVGSVLLPGVGTIIGGAMGAKKKDKSLLTIVVQDELERTYTLTFRCDEKQYGEFSKYILR